MKTVLIVSDVYTKEQVNGIGTWLINTKINLENTGHKVVILNSTFFKYKFPLPSYPEIRLALTTPSNLKKIIKQINPDFIHISTEGTLGIITRYVCIKNKWNFTSSYHTKFPEYLFARTNLHFLQSFAYFFLRSFHNQSKSIFVTTLELKKDLMKRGFKNLKVIGLGVDTNLFTKNDSNILPRDFAKPIFVYFGRIAPEKNVEEYLKLKLPGTKLVIGEGPSKNILEKKYTDSIFLGYKFSQELVNWLSICDVFVFPSKTDTFGLTIIEALACNLPVAAYDVQGPKNIITNDFDGYLGPDLKINALKCLKINRENCRTTAEKYSWKEATDNFLKSLVDR